MNSETFGMFGPRGLLAKIDADEEQDNRVEQTLKKTGENTVTVNRRISYDRPIVQRWKKFIIALKKNRSIPFVPLSDLPPVEAAFSIDKISKTIFSLLEPSDLLRCRLVSSSWLRMATNDKLLKLESNVIRIWQNQLNKDFEAVGRWGKTGTRPLKDLTNVLDGVGSHPFPCSAFEITGMAITRSGFLKFFDRYGFLVKNLEIASPVFDAGRSESNVYTRDSLLEFVTKLLTEQMPNLETLKMEFDEKVELPGEIEPQLLLSIKEGLYCAGKHNQNLRKIELDENVPYEIIEALCCLAPKLERLDVDDLEFWVKNKHLLHLLKELKFNPDTNEQALEAIISGGENKLRLQKLSVNFCSYKSAPSISPGQPELLKRIFDFCCHSLEELHLSPFSFLPEQVLPRMPKVKVLRLKSLGEPPDSRSTSNPDPDETFSYSFFPQGTSLATTFPNLNTIVVSLLSKHDLRWRFLSLYKNEEIASVKSIHAYRCGSDVTVFQEHFPNAVVTMPFTPDQ